jgi:hypothetical protein
MISNSSTAISFLTLFKAFFLYKNFYNLTNVQFVHLSIIDRSIAITILFVFTKLYKVTKKAKHNKYLVEPKHNLKGYIVSYIRS